MSAGTVRHMEYIRVRLVWCMCTVHRIVLMQFKVTNHAFTFSLHFIEKYRQCTCRYIPQYSPIQHTISLSLLFPVIPFCKLASSPLPRFAQDPFSKYETNQNPSLWYSRVNSNVISKKKVKRGALFAEINRFPCYTAPRSRACEESQCWDGRKMSVTANWCV